MPRRQGPFVRHWGCPPGRSFPIIVVVVGFAVIAKLESYRRSLTRPEPSTKTAAAADSHGPPVRDVTDANPSVGTSDEQIQQGYLGIMLVLAIFLPLLLASATFLPTNQSPPTLTELDRACEALLTASNENDAQARDRLAELLSTHPGWRNALGKRFQREARVRVDKRAWARAAAAYMLAGQCGRADTLEAGADCFMIAGDYYRKAHSPSSANKCYTAAIDAYSAARCAYVQYGQDQDGDICAERQGECRRLLDNLPQNP